MITFIGKKVSLVNYLGKTIKIGEIVSEPFDVDGNSQIMVLFRGETNPKKYMYPEAFEKALDSEDTELLIEIAIAKREKQEAKENAEKERQRQEKLKIEEEQKRINEIKQAEEKRHAEEERKRDEQRRRMVEGLSINAYDYLVNQRKVERLVHFTPLANLKSIFDKGLLPRKYVPEDAIVLDQNRLDGMIDCTCLSITYPNRQLLKKHQYNTGYNFVILEINPTIIKDKAIEKVFFTKYNAASSCEGYKYDLSKKYGLFYAERMFEDGVIDYGEGEKSLRETKCIPNNRPTDEQAEVLIRGVIPPNYITKILVANGEIKDVLEKAMSEGIIDKIAVEIHPGLF